MGGNIERVDYLFSVRWVAVYVAHRLFKNADGNFGIYPFWHSGL